MLMIPNWSRVIIIIYHHRRQACQTAIATDAARPAPMSTFRHRRRIIAASWSDTDPRPLFPVKTFPVYTCSIPARIHKHTKPLKANSPLPPSSLYGRKGRMACGEAPARNSENARSSDMPQFDWMARMRRPGISQDGATRVKMGSWGICHRESITCGF